MRKIAIIAGVAFAVTALPVASQAACHARGGGTIFSAVAQALFGRPTGPCAPASVPGDDRAKAVSAPNAEPAQRPAAEACRHEALPHYDASGQATPRPSRACGPPLG